MPDRILVLGTYPESESSCSGAFNRVFVRKISKTHSVVTVSLHVWLPGRPWYKVISDQGMVVVYVYAPQVPFLGEYSLTNARLASCSIERALLLIGIKKEIKLVHAVGLFNLTGMLVAEILETKLLLQFIGTDAEMFRKMKKTIRRRLAKVTTKITCNSSGLNSAIAGKAGYFNCIPEVIYRGVDNLSEMEMNDFTLGGRRRYLFLGGFPQYSMVDYRGLGMEGSRDVKGGISLLRTWHKAAKQCMIAADSMLYVGGPYASRESLLKVGIAIEEIPNVRFVGPLGHKEALNYINAADVVFLPSYSEGVPNVAMEAMSMGKVVVARRVGGLPELITDNTHGRLFISNEELLDTLREIEGLSSIDLQTIGKRAQKLVGEKFQNDNMVERYRTIYTNHGATRKR